MVVRACRKDLAIATGKTRSLELAFGGAGPGSNWDMPRNRWVADQHRVTGGASSWAGVSLCDGSALVALGTDIGGSALIPASMTGSVGLKSTIGRWSTGALSRSLVHSMLRA